MKSETSAALLVWAVSDGRAGNVAQALGLAEAIARRRPATVREIRVEPKPPLSVLPPRLWHLGGARPGGWPFTGYRGLPALQPPWPDLVIGAGRRVAPLVAGLRRAYGLCAVQLLDPQMPASAFDLVVAPRHDRLRAPNALTTIGSIGRLTAERIDREAAHWQPRLGHLARPRLAVLIGGPSRSVRWRAADGEALVAVLARLADEGHALMVTPSRRTPGALVARIERALDARAFVWDGQGENPYPAILGLADAVLVTEDSVNMASEAASTGKPVHLFPLSRVGRKIRRFHDALIERGAARRFAGGIGAWTYEPLDEADRIAAEIDVRLLTG